MTKLGYTHISHHAVDEISKILKTKIVDLSRVEYGHIIYQTVCLTVGNQAVMSFWPQSGAPLDYRSKFGDNEVNRDSGGYEEKRPPRAVQHFYNFFLTDWRAAECDYGQSSWGKHLIVYFILFVAKAWGRAVYWGTGLCCGISWGCAMYGTQEMT